MEEDKNTKTNVFKKPHAMDLSNLNYDVKNPAQNSSTSSAPLAKGSAKIVQFADENRTLPDGSKIIYAENEEKIVLYLKKQYEKGKTFVYERKTGTILVNGTPGTNEDKREMIRLGAYMLGNCKESDMVTISIQK